MSVSEVADWKKGSQVCVWKSFLDPPLSYKPSRKWWLWCRFPSFFKKIVVPLISVAKNSRLVCRCGNNGSTYVPTLVTLGPIWKRAKFLVTLKLIWQKKVLYKNSCVFWYGSQKVRVTFSVNGVFWVLEALEGNEKMKEGKKNPLLADFVNF